LESIVNKTIANDNNVFEVPLVDEKDQYLEEVARNFDSVTEPTEGTIDYEIKLTTHQTQQTDESEVELPTTKFTTPSTSTINEEIVEHDSNTAVMMTSPPEEETETVFVAPNENTNNEVVNNNNLERLSIETTITPASTSSTIEVVEESFLTTTATMTTTTVS
jgi:hypothetical protein